MAVAQVGHIVHKSTRKYTRVGISRTPHLGAARTTVLEQTTTARGDRRLDGTDGLEDNGLNFAHKGSSVATFRRERVEDRSE